MCGAKRISHVSLSSHLVWPEASRELSVNLSSWVWGETESERLRRARERDSLWWPPSGTTWPSTKLYLLLPFSPLSSLSMRNRDDWERVRVTEELRRRTQRGCNEGRRQFMAAKNLSSGNLWLESQWEGDKENKKRRERQRRTTKEKNCRTSSSLGSPFTMVSFKWSSRLQFTTRNVLVVEHRRRGEQSWWGRTEMTVQNSVAAVR